MILLRHGQSAFNLHFTATRRDPGIVDPPLTPDGCQQIRTAAYALRGAAIRRIIVSPYTRALQTAAAVAELLDAPICIEPLVRERYAFSCDVGTNRTKLAALWPQHDFSAIEEVWWPEAFEPEQEVIERADLFRRAMRTDPQASSSLLVSHWGFLLALTGRSLANGEWIEWNPATAAPEEISWQ